MDSFNNRNIFVNFGYNCFFLSKKIIQKQLQKNPLITEKQIRAMYMQMGRKLSEIDIKKVINSIKKVK